MDCIENKKKDKANNQLAPVQEIAGLFSLKLSILNSVFRLVAHFAVFIKVLSEKAEPRIRVPVESFGSGWRNTDGKNRSKRLRLPEDYGDSFQGELLKQYAHRQPAGPAYPYCILFIPKQPIGE